MNKSIDTWDIPHKWVDGDEVVVNSLAHYLQELEYRIAKLEEAVRA